MAAYQAGRTRSRTTEIAIREIGNDGHAGSDSPYNAGNKRRAAKEGSPRSSWSSN